MFLVGGGSEDIWDYEEGGGRSMRFFVCARDLLADRISLMQHLLELPKQNKFGPTLLFVAFVRSLIQELCCVSEAQAVRKQSWQRNGLMLVFS